MHLFYVILFQIGNLYYKLLLIVNVFMGEALYVDGNGVWLTGWINLSFLF